eukprot:992783-Prorocentrum_minimum.AAC.1
MARRYRCLASVLPYRGGVPLDGLRLYPILRLDALAPPVVPRHENTCCNHTYTLAQHDGVCRVDPAFR